ncbi:MAG: GntR family transcriptional regulator [Peptococcaceae bacterium]
MSGKLIKAEPLYLQAYYQLKDDITEGNLKPGQRLTDQQLAEWLGISRTPVREAARILCSEGLLKSDSGVVTVYKPSLEDIYQVYFIRASSESLAASVIAIKENKKEIADNLEKIIARSVTAFQENDIRLIQELNREFHNSLINFSGLDILKQIYEPLDVKMKIFRSFSLKKDYHRTISIKEHQELTEYIIKGDVVPCKFIIERHILTAGKRAMQEYAKMEGLDNSDVIVQTNKYIDAILEG